MLNRINLNNSIKLNDHSTDFVALSHKFDLFQNAFNRSHLLSSLKTNILYEQFEYQKPFNFHHFVNASHSIWFCTFESNAIMIHRYARVTVYTQWNIQIEYNYTMSNDTMIKRTKHTYTQFKWCTRH